MNQNIEKVALPYDDQASKEALASIADKLKEQRGAQDMFKRNRAKVCTFFIRGECKRAKLCPYRHTDISKEEIEELEKAKKTVD